MYGAIRICWLYREQSIGVHLMEIRFLKGSANQEAASINSYRETCELMVK